MSCSFCIILILQKYESSHSSHLIGSFSCSNGMIFECHLPEVISDLLIMLCFYIMKNWITSLFWESCQHPHPHSAHSAQIRWHSYPALLHWQEKESSYLSPNYSFQAAWTGQTAIVWSKQLGRNNNDWDIRSLSLVSTVMLMLDVVAFKVHSIWTIETSNDVCVIFLLCRIWLYLISLKMLIIVIIFCLSHRGWSWSIFGWRSQSSIV